MPNGIFPIPNFRTTETHRSSWGLRTRLRVHLTHNRLSRELAGGADPSSSRDLSLRAAQVRSEAGRARLANALVEAVGEARRGEPMTIRRQPQRAEVCVAAEELLALASRLRARGPVDVRGAAMVALLVNDHASPLHRVGARRLREAVAEAHSALIPVQEAEQDLAAAA
jgi:hypothetical protein